MNAPNIISRASCSLTLSDQIDEFEAAIASLLVNPSAAVAVLLIGALTDDDDYLDEIWSILPEDMVAFPPRCGC